MTHLRVVPFSLQDPDYEIASIVADALSSKLREKKFGFFKTSGEEVAFISKLYMPFYAKSESGTSFVLGCSLFSRQFDLLALDKASISSIVNRDSLDVEKLSELHAHCDPTEETMATTAFHIPGAYPSSLPGTLRSELSFIRQIEDVTHADGTVMPMELSVTSTNESIERIKDARSLLIEDKTFLSRVEESMDKGVDATISILEGKRKELTLSYRSQYRNAVDTEQQVLKALKEEVDSKSQEAIVSFEVALNEILDKNDYARELLFIHVSKPAVSIDALRDKIAAVRRVISPLTDAELHGDKGDISYHCDAAVKKLSEISAYEAERRDDITRGSRAIRIEWDEKVAELNSQVDALRSEHARCIESIHRMLSHKNDELYMLDASTSMEVSIDGVIYLPFYVVSIASGNSVRLILYPVSRKQGKSKLMTMLRSFTMPFVPHTRGVEQLATMIQSSIESESPLREKILDDGPKYNILKDEKTLMRIKRGLKRLNEEGLLRDKQYEKVLNIIS